MKWPPGEKRSPGAADTATEAQNNFHTLSIIPTDRIGKPVSIGVVTGRVVADLVAVL